MGALCSSIPKILLFSFNISHSRSPEPESSLPFLLNPSPTHLFSSMPKYQGIQSLFMWVEIDGKDMSSLKVATLLTSGF